MRMLILAVAALVAQNATAQHVGDPRLDDLARQYENRFKSIEARLDALEGKKVAVAAPVAPTGVSVGETMVCGPGGCTTVSSFGYAQPATYYQAPMFAAPMYSFGEGGGCVGGSCGSQSFGRRGLFGRRR